ncbi:MAG: hypothetical protein ABJH70_16540, partial [Nitratireductor sp.]
ARVAAHFGEFADIGAGAEIRAGTAKHDHARRFVFIESIDGRRDLSPHGKRHGVFLRRTVECHCHDAIGRSRDTKTWRRVGRSILKNAHFNPIEQTLTKLMFYVGAF